MPFVPAPNIVMVEVLGLKDGQVVENRLHVNVLHAPTPADLTLLGNLFTNWVTFSYATVLPDDVTITGLQLTSLHEQNGIQLAVPLAVVGGTVDVSMPNEVTYCVSLRSGFVGRSARGRFYTMGIARVNVLGENRVQVGYRAAITAVLQTIIDDIAANSFVMVIVSYINNGLPRPGGPVYFVVANATTTDDILDSQRRRRPGIGS